MTDRGQAERGFALQSQSAFVRGFIDDKLSSVLSLIRSTSQSAFVRGFIDDITFWFPEYGLFEVSIRVRARLHR